MTSLPGLSGDRLKRAIAAFVRELFPNIDYYRPHLYSVATWDPVTQTGDLVPNAAIVGMPSLGRVPIRSPGIAFTLAPGHEVVVSFDNGDPTRPFISHLGTLGSGLVPTLTGLAGAGPSDPSVARVGDTVTSHTFAFNPGSGGASLTIDGNTITTPVAITGVITSGSTRVKSR